MEKWQEAHCLSNADQEHWIHHPLDRDTAGARKRVEDAETAIKQEQEDTRNAEDVGLTPRQSEKMIEKMFDGIRDSLRDLARSDDEEARGDQHDEDTELCKLSKDDKPGWVIATIMKTVQQRMGKFQKKQMKLWELTKLGWGDNADYFRESDQIHRTAKLSVPASIKLQMDEVSAALAPTTFGQRMETLDIILVISQMPQGTSRWGGSRVRLDSEKPGPHECIVSLPPDAVPDLSAMSDPVFVEYVITWLWVRAGSYYTTYISSMS